MTLSTQISKTAFAGNGVTCVFPLPFPYIREDDIRAVLRQEGHDTPLLSGTHYGLSGAGSPAGGSLAMLEPPATGQTLVVWRAPAIVQEVDYVENSAFPAETHEAALDLLTMICQSLQEQIDRAVRYPVSTPVEDILGSPDFLEATRSNKAAALAAQFAAEDSAAQASGSASAASASAASASASASAASAIAGGGTVRVSTGDTAAQTLSAKLLAGNGLSESIENAGSAEALRLGVALAANPGLEFAAGLLRVKAGSGLTLGAGGLAADVGTGANKLVQLDASGRLPAVDASQLANMPTRTSDLAVMNAFLAQIAAARSSGPIPGGYLWLFGSDELATKTGASYDPTNKLYYNTVTYTDETANLSAVAQVNFDRYGYGNTALLGYLRNGSLSENTALCSSSSSSLSFDLIFPVAKTIGKLRFYKYSNTGRMKSFVLYRYNGGAWTKVPILSFLEGGSIINGNEGQTANADGWETIAFAPVSDSQFRIVFSDFWNYGDGGGRVSEVQIFSCAGALNMALIPAPLASGSAPGYADLYLLHKAVDTVTLNTDLKVRATRDGANWTGYGSLAALCDYDANFKLLKATLDFTGLAAGASFKPEISTYNAKSQQLRAIAALLR